MMVLIVNQHKLNTCCNKFSIVLCSERPKTRLNSIIDDIDVCNAFLSEEPRNSEAKY